MEFVDLVRRRTMVRTYQADRPVPRGVVRELVELATHAPSAGFSQGWHFLVLDEVAARTAFWAMTARAGEPDAWLTGMRSAPVLILCFADQDAYLERYAAPDKSNSGRSGSQWPIPYWHVDTGMAALLVLLGAVDSGLGGCFFGLPAEYWTPVREQFGVPTRLVPVGVVSLGYPAPERRSSALRPSSSLRRGRRPTEQISSYNHFGTSG